MARAPYKVIFSNAEIAYGGEKKYGRAARTPKPNITSPVPQNAEAEAAAAYFARVFGQNLKIDWFHESEEAVFIRLASVSESAICPYCGRESTKHHGREVRYVQDMTMFDKPCYIKVVLFRYECQNYNEYGKINIRKCEKRSFVEVTSLAGRYSTRTLRTDAMLLEFAIVSSFRATAAAMTRLGAPINHTTIARIISSITIDIESEIIRIGCDDVNKHKGLTYYTVIYDAVTHMCLALMDGRDGGALESWLEAHQEVKEVMRDRASAYAVAITKTLGDKCIQVADKFHLIDNLNKHLQDALYEQMPAKTKIFVQYTETEDGKMKGTILDKTPALLYDIRERQDSNLSDLVYDCTPPVNPDNTREEYNFAVTSKSEVELKKAAEKREEKKRTAREVREHCAQLNAEGKEINYDRIMREFGVSKYMTQKYLAMSEEEVEMISEPPKSRKTEPVSPFIHMIYKMLKNGVKPWDIYCYIYFYTDFCKGLKDHELESAQNRLASYINAVIGNNFPGIPELKLSHYAKCRYASNIRKYTRTDISRHLLTTNEKTPRDERLDLIMPELTRQYPIIATLHDCAASFREVMNGDDADELDGWIAKNDKVVPSFCKGLRQDIEPVKNAIRTHDTSGFVEGSNTAFKLVKRIGCGRYTTKCLYIKFTLFLARKRGINPYQIISEKKLVI